MLKMLKKIALIFKIQDKQNVLRFHAFSGTSRSTKTEKLVYPPKYATKYKVFSGSI